MEIERMEITTENIIRLDDLKMMYMAYFNHELSDKESDVVDCIYRMFNNDSDLCSYFIEYCAANNITDIDNILETAETWKKRKVRTKEDADDMLKSPYQIHSYVLNALEINRDHHRNYEIVKDELNMINKWLFDWDFSVEMIKEAADITNRKGIHNITYIDGILRKWRDNKIFSIKALKEHEKEYFKNIEEAYLKENGDVDKNYIIEETEKDGIFLENPNLHIIYGREGVQPVLILSHLKYIDETSEICDSIVDQVIDYFDRRKDINSDKYNKMTEFLKSEYNLSDEMISKFLDTDDMTHIIKYLIAVYSILHDNCFDIFNFGPVNFHNISESIRLKNYWESEEGRAELKRIGEENNKRYEEFKDKGSEK